ncbi:hypothetical protein BV22DRAFT_1050168 [Leucogyrophana mollusca]|uniref:Uncharacterized protein n=1 Tax=Leucogyrophana mollusca TaxID=85980 RepID=A0ACB8B5J6_9AGAM|nr:hypothetical protein BV22DRAFT_1050168 [Leucogyrophana mollusca]
MSAHTSPSDTDLPTADSPGAGPSSSRIRAEFRKDGAISKMRSHRGNVPVLPQTKLCPHCPAKFTRTTHLNRHMRTHTGERLHRCDSCDAQFTRSDLLTRHKKTCGDPSLNRTRRRSCQACAESKVKCDLVQPCSKCQSRGKDCVFSVRSVRRGTSESIQDTKPSIDAPPTPSEASTSPGATSPSSGDPSPLGEISYASFEWAPSPSQFQTGDKPSWNESYSDTLSPAPSEGGASSVGFASSSGSDHQVRTSPLYPNASEPYFTNVFTAYPANPNPVHTEHRPRISHSASPISSVDEAFSFTAQPIDIPPPMNVSADSIFYDTTPNSSAFVSSSLPERARFIQPQPTYGSVFNTRVDMGHIEHQYNAGHSDYPRARPKVASSVPGFEGARHLPEVYNDQLPREYLAGNTDAPYPKHGYGKQRSYGADLSRPANGHFSGQWIAPPEDSRVGMFESTLHAGHDNITYRHHCSECYMDNIRSNSSFIMRRQIAGVDLA